MTTNRPTRKQILAAIVAQVAQDGQADGTSIRLYVSSRISRLQFDQAVELGRQIHSKAKRAA